LSFYVGIVDLTKEVEIINRNRWPEDLNRWNGISRKKLKSYVIDTLGDGALIGDVDILKMAPCDSSARAQTKCLLVIPNGFKKELNSFFFF
jgi:hypothetical protein